MKLFESEKTLAFLDIGPLSKGHSVRKNYADLYIRKRRY
jgi:diadenosine tetraphosphate (Ap4A) HIT family hydrolase